MPATGEACSSPAKIANNPARTLRGSKDEKSQARGQSLVAATTATLFVVSLFESLASVLRQALPALPLFAQMFFILLRQILPPPVVP